MRFEHLRHIIDELHRGHPEIDDAEVKINIGALLWASTKSLTS